MDRAQAEHSINTQLWSEYLEQQIDIKDVMEDLGWQYTTATNKQTDILNAQIIYCKDLFAMWMGSEDTYPKFGIVDDTPKVHYIAIAGLKGCLPNYCTSHDTAQSAYSDLLDIHNIDFLSSIASELSLYGYADLDLTIHGNEYAEVIECDCDDPSQHDD